MVINTCSNTFSTNGGGSDSVINPQLIITVSIINRANIWWINIEMQNCLKW